MQGIVSHLAKDHLKWSMVAANAIFTTPEAHCIKGKGSFEQEFVLRERRVQKKVDGSHPGQSSLFHPCRGHGREGLCFVVVRKRCSYCRSSVWNDWWVDWLSISNI